MEDEVVIIEVLFSIFIGNRVMKCHLDYLGSVAC